jgi:hypothetical protein
VTDREGSAIILLSPDHAAIRALSKVRQIAACRRTSKRTQLAPMSEHSAVWFA